MHHLLCTIVLQLFERFSTLSIRMSLKSGNPTLQLKLLSYQYSVFLSSTVHELQSRSIYARTSPLSFLFLATGHFLKQLLLGLPDFLIYLVHVNIACCGKLDSLPRYRSSRDNTSRIVPFFELQASKKTFLRWALTTPLLDTSPKRSFSVSAVSKIAACFVLSESTVVQSVGMEGCHKCAE